MWSDLQLWNFTHAPITPMCYITLYDTHIHAHTRTYSHARTHAHTHMHTHAHTYTHARTNTHTHLMEGEIREDDSNVILNTYNQSSIPIIPTGYHFNMIPHLKELPQFSSRKLQWILHNMTLSSTKS